MVFKWSEKFKFFTFMEKKGTRKNDLMDFTRFWALPPFPTHTVASS